ncbi:MAG: thrombospondin type 3 repeat-containing protein, partial [Myxococcota bacterium]
MRRRFPHMMTLLSSALLMLPGCGSGSSDIDSVEGRLGPPQGALQGDSDGDGILDEVEELLGTNPEERSSVCAESSYVSILPDEAPPVVDFVVSVDTS